VREELARGLTKALLHAADEKKPELSAALRTQLVELAEAHPQDSWVELLRSEGLL